LTNKCKKTPKKKVLITGCIHGNELISTSTIMAYIGNILKSNNKPEIRKLLNTREIYFIPVVSPDSYSKRRASDGVDPNRNFPTPSRPNFISVQNIAVLQKFFLKHRFSAVISGHSSGRYILYPYGDNNGLCPDDSKYNKIIQHMSQMCGYRIMRACQIYGQPIKGTEVDWYYRNGAFSIVIEYGNHQNTPSKQEIQTEFNKTYKAALYFISASPKIIIKSNYHNTNIDSYLPY
jgi:predicted deacylase